MSQFSYQAHLDGLRGISILLVVIGHAGLGHILPGGLGVTVFFFISGFLITSLLLNERERTNNIDLKGFYLRRFWRLTPPVVLHVVLSLALLWVVNGTVKWIEPASVFFYFANYYKIFEHYTMTGAQYSPFDIYWSLAVEEHFYLFFTPLLVFVRSRRAVFVLTLLLLVLPLVIRIGITQHFDANFSDEYTYRATDARLDSIAYGCLLAVMGAARFTGPRALMLFALGICGLLASLLYRDAYFRQVIRYSVQGISLLLVCGPLMFSDQLAWARRLLSNAPLVYVGKLSYSMYLYHWLALIVVYLVVGSQHSSLPWQAAYWVLTMALSMLSYYAIERPSVSLRRRFGSNA
jgi:peptidoglycan/LPS O-acetylase OafA/YrhL